MFTARAVQGQGTLIAATVSACPVDATLPLSGTISDGLTGEAILPIVPQWGPGGPPEVIATLTPNQTAALAPGGYVIQVGLLDGAGPLVYGSLQVVAAPGGATTFDVLTTPGRVLLSDPTIKASPDRVAALPPAIRAASEIVRRVCYRRFTRGVYTEHHVLSQEGEVRLLEFPVNQVTRISHKLREAVAVSADPARFQTAYVNFVAEDGPIGGPEAVTYTGINLVGASSGASTTATLSFSGMTTIDDLVAAVNAEAGWKATTNGYGAWPIGEVYCDGAAQGALSGDAEFRVFSEDARPQRIDRRTGYVYMGYGRYSGAFGPRWGPAWAQFDDAGLAGSSEVVRVVYDAGFTVIPDAVQDATVALTRLLIDRMLIDYTLKSESIGQYSYQLNDQLLALAVPGSIMGTLAPYMGHLA